MSWPGDPGRRPHRTWFRQVHADDAVVGDAMGRAGVRDLVDRLDVERGRTVGCTTRTRPPATPPGWWRCDGGVVPDPVSDGLLAVPFGGRQPRR